LEATSIHLIQRGIAMLLKFFPTRDFEPADIERYNRTLEQEFAHVRDFLLMHYSHTARAGAFWTHCREIAPTDALTEKLELFKSHGRILREDSEVFPVQSWLTVMIGQNIRPRGYDPMTDMVAASTIRAKLDEIRRDVKASTGRMPSHADFIAEHCAGQ
jgi:tryptophan halogenase